MKNTKLLMFTEKRKFNYLVLGLSLATILVIAAGMFL